MNPNSDAQMRDVERLIRESKELIQRVKWRRRLHALLLLVALALGALGLYWKGSELLFGRTLTFEFSGIHAPQYTRAEFERVFRERFVARGFTIETFRITYESHLKQFDGEITVSGLPVMTSKYDVLGHLREIGNSMKDKALPVETPIGP